VLIERRSRFARDGVNMYGGIVVVDSASYVLLDKRYAKNIYLQQPNPAKGFYPPGNRAVAGEYNVRDLRYQMGAGQSHPRAWLGTCSEMLSVFRQMMPFGRAAHP